MRSCDHMPGAAKDVPCPLCKDLTAHGKPVTKSAFTTLNHQQKKEAMRACPMCNSQVKDLVSAHGKHICVACAEAIDEG